MTGHETARQRAARHKRDPYRAAQIAPSHPMPAVRCKCSHARLMHEFETSGTGRCLNRACGCAEYREASGG